MHNCSDSVWSMADLCTVHTGTAAKKRAWNGACFFVTMATSGRKQYFLQGISRSLCGMLPGCRWPWARSSAYHVLSSLFNLPQLPCCASCCMTSLRDWQTPVLTDAPDFPWHGAGGKRGSCLWRLVRMERMDGGAPSSCLLPPTCTASTPMNLKGLYGKGRSLSEKKKPKVLASFWPHAMPEGWAGPDFLWTNLFPWCNCGSILKIMFNEVLFPFLLLLLSNIWPQYWESKALYLLWGMCTSVEPG